MKQVLEGPLLSEKQQNQNVNRRFWRWKYGYRELYDENEV